MPRAARSRETTGDTEGWHESERPTYRELAAVTAGRLLSVGRSPGAPARGRGVGRVDLGSVCRQGHQPNNRNRVTDGGGKGQEEVAAKERSSSSVAVKLIIKYVIKPQDFRISTDSDVSVL